jgi:N-acetylglucosamine-6-phosphate deacetylase
MHASSLKSGSFEFFLAKGEINPKSADHADARHYIGRSGGLLRSPAMERPSTFRITGGQVVTPTGLERRDIQIAGDQQQSVSDGDDPNVVDATGLVISPGFIDLQVNGGYGLDLSADPARLWDLGKRLPSHGVTSFLPTIITSPPATGRVALQALRRRPEDYIGAEPLGIHFEGPMLSPERPGAHPVEHLRPVDPRVTDGWSSAEGVAMVTIAPELDNALPMISELVARGVAVAAGHSKATSDEAHAGLIAGVTMVTHLFNAMAPLGHRNPNLVGLALAEKGLVAGLIVDGVHVDPVAVAVAWNAKGPRGIALITDSVAAMGMPPGTYKVGQRTVTADESGVRNSNGTLAGSVLTMDRAIRNLVAYTGCEPSEALISATATPASVISESRRGRIEAGELADIVLLDEDLEVQITICSGRIVHVSEAAAHRIPAGLMQDR